MKISNQVDKQTEPPVLVPGFNYGSVTDKITEVVLTPRTPRFWYIGFGIGFLIVMVFLFAITWLLFWGVGIWGIMIPVAWGFAIINFVWWIGIGHAGTLISAFLLLMRQQWRTSINRFAEAMTLFAVANAGMFPILHMGRPWLFFYMLPYPNSMGLWPQFRSPLVWDVFAVTTYLTVSIMFWFLGLVPDLATMRDKATNRYLRTIYGILAMGWKGSARGWKRFETGYFLMAALATPLVISVHSIVGMDFAFAQLPGWHSTIFPPYFVAGAIFSGFAMVLTITIPLRRLYHLEGMVTENHLDKMAKVMLAMGLIVAYGYMMENFMAWYSGDVFEIHTALDRLIGIYSPIYWLLLLCNVAVPQLLWIKKIRLNTIWLWIISILINVGMWSERFIIIVQSLHNDFLPSMWATYSPTIWDVLTFVGTLGLFLTLFLLFMRTLPAISIFEVRDLVHKTEHPEAETGD